MLELKDIKELLGKKIAIICLLLIISGTAIYFFDLLTGSRLRNRIRGYFSSPPPIAINHLELHQTPPDLMIGPRHGFGVDRGFLRGIELTIPLRITNRTDQVLLIENLEITFKSLDRFNEFKEYNNVMAALPSMTKLDPNSFAEIGSEHPRDMFILYEGGYLKGSPYAMYKFKDETDLSNSMAEISNSSNASTTTRQLNEAYFPLKLDPYGDIVLNCAFELRIMSKDGKDFSEATPLGIGEGMKENLIKLTPIFFGATDYQVTLHDAIFTVQTNLGPFSINSELSIFFVGTKIYIPPEFRLKKSADNKQSKKPTPTPKPIK